MEKRESKEVGGRMFVALLFLVTGKRTPPSEEQCAWAEQGPGRLSAQGQGQGRAARWATFVRSFQRWEEP